MIYAMAVTAEQSLDQMTSLSDTFQSLLPMILFGSVAVTVLTAVVIVIYYFNHARKAHKTSVEITQISDDIHAIRQILEAQAPHFSQTETSSTPEDLQKH